MSLRRFAPSNVARITRFYADAVVDPPRRLREAKKLVASDRPVVVGPWAGEIGFEVLYWLPFLRWLRDHAGLEAGQAIAISRGGVRSWYGGIADGYVELLDHFEPAEMKRFLTERIGEDRTQKQLSVGAFEEEVLRRAGPALGEEPVLLHPSLMYLRYGRAWDGIRSIAPILGSSVFAPITAPPKPDGLPERYVAVKAYFSKPFPDTAENRRFLEELIARLRERGREVVLLDSGIDIDDHVHAAPQAAVHEVSGLMTAADNLEVQTAIIAGADALVTTYGGFSYVGPSLGMPTVSIASTDRHKLVHLDVANRMCAALRAAGHAASHHLIRTDEIEALEAVL